MKVYGELERAILQQLTSNPSPLVAGMVWVDITSASKAVPKFYNGTSVLNLQTSQSSSLISQNSGSAVTVDWSTGVNQQVILTANTVISFSNPQTGQVHTLIVTQGVTTGKSPGYSYQLNMTDQDSRRGWYQPQSMPQVDQNQFYQWFYSAGVKPGYATFPSLTFGPLVLTATATLASDMSPSGKGILVSNSTSPFTFGYQIFDNANAPSFGAKALVTSATAAAAVVACKYSPDGNSIFTVGATTPFIQGWFADRDTPVGSAWANPTNLPVTAGTMVAVHPNGGWVAVGCTGASNTGKMIIYPYSGGGFGNVAAGAAGDLTNLAGPATAYAAAPYGIEWSPEGDYLSIIGATTPFLQTYAFTSTPGAGAVGAVSANPGVLPVGGPSTNLGKQLAWRPQGDYIACTTGNTTPFLYVVPFNRSTGAYGTPLTITALAAQATCVAWTPDGQYLLVGCTASPWLYCFDFSAQTIGTTIAFDSGAMSPAQRINDIIMSPGGDWAILCLNASIFLSGILLPTKARNYLRLLNG